MQEVAKCNLIYFKRVYEAMILKHKNYVLKLLDQLVYIHHISVKFLYFILIDIHFK